MRFSLRNFVTTAASVQTGLLQGRQQAQQERQAEADRSFQRNMSVFQAGRQIEDEHRRSAEGQDQALLQMLPALDERSRALVLQHVYQHRGELNAQPSQFDSAQLGQLLPPGRDYDPLRRLFPGNTSAAAAPGIQAAPPAAGSLGPNLARARATIAPPGSPGAQSPVPGAPPPPGMAGLRENLAQSLAAPQPAPAMQPAATPPQPQPGHLNVPGIGDLALKGEGDDEAYGTAIAALNHRLLDTGPTAIRDPQQRALLQQHLLALRTGQKTGKSIGELGLGAAGLDALNPPAIDPREADKALGGVEATVKSLQKLAGGLPNDENGAILRQNIETLLGSAPARGTNFDPEAVQKWQGQAAHYLTLRNAPNLDNTQMVQDARAHDLRLGQLAQLDPQAQASELVDALDAERDLRKRQGTRRTTAPILESQGEDIEQIRSLLATGDRERAGELAREVVGRIGTRSNGKQQQTLLSGLMRHIGSLPARDQNNPALVRKLYQSYGLGYLVDGLPDAGLKLGGARGEKEWARLTDPAKLNEVAKLDPKSQKLYLDELTGLAKATGRSTVDLPAQVVQKLSPADKLRLDNQGLEIRIKAQRLVADRERFQMDRQLNAERLKLLQGKNAGLTAGAKGQPGGWGGAPAREASRLQHEADQAYALYKQVFAGNAGLSTFDFDPEDPQAAAKAPKGLQHDVGRAVQLYQAWRTKAGAAKDYLGKFANQPAPGAPGIGQQRTTGIGMSVTTQQRTAAPPVAIAAQKGINVGAVSPEALANALVRRSGGALTYQQALQKAHAALGR